MISAGIAWGATAIFCFESGVILVLAAISTLCERGFLF